MFARKLVVLTVMLLLGAVTLGSAAAAASIKAASYAKHRHWLALPRTNPKKVDVFYLYPTRYQ